MKRLFAIALMACLPLLVTAQDRDKDKDKHDRDHFRSSHENDNDRDRDKDKDDKDHFRFTQDGEFATISQSLGPNSFSSLTVSRGSSTSSPSSASLQYFALDLAADFSTETITNVFGPIPASAFTGNTTALLVLDIDTGTLDPTKFSSESCTLDLVTFLPPTCGSGPVGLIHLEFRENNLARTIVDLKQTTIAGPVTTRLHQMSDNSSANVQGVLFAVPVTGATANVGVNHQSTLEITHD